MNDSILKQLKIMVERIVQPIRASTAAKRTIQEELLAHVVEVFEEEVSRLADERAALTRTEQRFGNSSELTGQLQDSITISGYSAWIVDQMWLRLARYVMLNHNRVYNGAFMVLGLYILVGLGLLAALLQMPPGARPHMRLPGWSLAPLAVINLFYLAAMIVTLVCRMAHLPIGKSLTRVMNVLFLIAPPFGTVLGIYGLWKVDRIEETCPLRIE
jgi:hypothetical protein